MMMIRRLRAFSKYDTLIYDPTSGRALYFIPPVPVYTLARRVALENSEIRFHVSIPGFNLEGLKWPYHYQNVQVIPLPSSRLSCVRQPAVTFVMQLSDHPCALKKNSTNGCFLKTVRYIESNIDNYPLSKETKINLKEKQLPTFKEYLKYLRLINREAVCEKRKLTQTRLCKYNLFNNFKYSL